MSKVNFYCHAKWSAAILTLAFISLSLSAALDGQSSSASSNPLPAGAMQEKAAEACSSCHEARIVVQQRLGKAAWTKEVDKMAKWGALVEPQDRDAFIDYLSANFGVDKPAYVADRLQNRAGNKNQK